MGAVAHAERRHKQPPLEAVWGVAKHPHHLGGLSLAVCGLLSLSLLPPVLEIQQASIDRIGQRLVDEIVGL